MGTEAERAAAPTCGVCRTGLRPQEVEHCEGLCSQCFQIALGPRPCVCGHDAREHGEGCHYFYWSQVLQTQVPCMCEGFTAQEAA